MEIQANKNMLLLRFNNYKGIDYISNHQNIIKETGYVWMLKAGKRIQATKLDKILADGGFLFLKAPKGSGGDYYLARFSKYKMGKPTSDMIYPKYYDKLSDSYNDNFDMFSILDGTWLKVEIIKKVDFKVSERLHLISNNKLVEEVLNTTRSSTMYITSDLNIKL